MNSLPPPLALPPHPAGAEVAAPIQQYQTWRQLLFLHWPVAVQQLRPLVPSWLDLDLWDGQAYVGAVPFEMYDVRLANWPAGKGFQFLETNLRTYVRVGDRCGVYFFSLDASHWLMVKAARWMWSLPYHWARMALRAEDGIVHSFTQRRRGGARLEVSYEVGEQLESPPGSLEHFLLERYTLYLQHRGRAYAGNVRHAPYPAYGIRRVEVNQTLLTAAGLEPLAGGEPAFAHFSPGVVVEVQRLQQLEEIDCRESRSRSFPDIRGSN